MALSLFLQERLSAGVDIDSRAYSYATCFSSQVTGNTSHGTYNGPALTTMGALSLNVSAASVTQVPAVPLTYPSDGQLHSNQSAPYVPYGGLGTNATPVYVPKFDPDYESLALALY
jgi:hypothetical protein